MSDKTKLVHLGTIIGVHGVRGFVKIKTFTTTPEDIVAYGPLSTHDGATTYSIHLKHMSKGMVVAHVEGVTDRNQAENLKGTKLYVPAAKLPSLEEDEFYYADLEGLEARTIGSGNIIGTISEIHDFGAGDFLVILDADGTKEYTIPFTKEAVPTLNVSEGHIILDPSFLIDDSKDTKPDEEFEKS